MAGPTFTPDETVPGVVLVDRGAQFFGDSRGDFLELWREGDLAGIGLKPGVDRFVQINRSRSGAGVLRGLHLQNPHGQGKLVRVEQGQIVDVAVDVRPDSETAWAWTAYTLSADNARQLYLPPYCAHGFYVTKGPATVVYSCTGYYDKPSEIGIRYDDPTIEIEWPDGERVLSERDAGNPTVQQWLAEPGRLPRVG